MRARRHTRRRDTLLLLLVHDVSGGHNHVLPIEEREERCHWRARGICDRSVDPETRVEQKEDSEQEEEEEEEGAGGRWIVSFKRRRESLSGPLLFGAPAATCGDNRTRRRTRKRRRWRKTSRRRRGSEQLVVVLVVVLVVEKEASFSVSIFANMRHWTLMAAIALAALGKFSFTLFFFFSSYSFMSPR